MTNTTNTVASGVPAKDSNMTRTVAALFVETGGVYFGLDGVDPWDEKRDARNYVGPHPVVAHPPCGPWGIFARQGKTKTRLGQDEGCFLAAYQAVNRYGGVLEHPAGSYAFEKHGLMRPPRGCWKMIRTGAYVTEFDQGTYGGPCKKPTWLYLVTNHEPPGLDWSHCWDKPAAIQRLSKKKRAATPIQVRDLLLCMARSCT